MWQRLPHRVDYCTVVTPSTISTTPPYYVLRKEKSPRVSTAIYCVCVLLPDKISYLCRASC